MGEDTATKKTCGQKCSASCTSFGQFLYTKDENGVTLVMGRTGNSWAKIGLFYLIFYGFLAGFFSAMLAVFLSTINKPEEGGPKLTQFIDKQPGLVRLDNREKFRLESYDKTDTNKQKLYTDFITKFMEGYNYPVNSGEFCDSNNIAGMPKNEKPCLFDYKKELGECANANNSYGLAIQKPCYFIKINKIYGWVPASDGTGYLKLKCNHDDLVKTFPEGFLLAAFPFRGQPDYQMPVVAVQIDLTKSSKVDEVECELQGKDVDVSSSAVPYRAYGRIRIEDISKD